MHRNRSYFSFPRFYLSLGFIFAVAAAVLFSMPSQLFAQMEVTEPPYISGQSLTAKGFIQVALDGETGNTVFIFTPDKAPSPTPTNAEAQAPLYLIAYPDPSDIPQTLTVGQTTYTYNANQDSPVPVTHLDCSVTNCKGLNVLPMPNPAYGKLSAGSGPCETFNGSHACSPVEGHDHLLGTPFTGGDFNVAWRKMLVVFTPAGIYSGAAHHRITTYRQLRTDLAMGYVVIMPVPKDPTFNCSLGPKRLYYEGSPVSVTYPDTDGDYEKTETSQP